MGHRLVYGSLYVAAFVLLSGCGLGTVGIVAGTASGGGTGTTPTTVSAVTVSGVKDSPATLTFVLTDGESDPASVRVLYFDPGEGPADAKEVALVGSPPLSALESSPLGMIHSFEWDFLSQVASGESFLAGYTVFVLVEGGSASLNLGINATEVDLGNDPPVVSGIQVPSDSESSGNVQVTFLVSDSSGDLVHVKAQFDIVGDAPDVGWQLARPAGAIGATPEYAITNLPTTAAGVDSGFVWDSAFDDDLHPKGAEVDVLLRFTPVDLDELGQTFEEGAPSQTPQIRIDNDQPPVAILRNGLLLTNPDETRGIPILFELLDAESDLIRVVFQWRRPEQSWRDFPLPLLRPRSRPCSRTRSGDARSRSAPRSRSPTPDVWRLRPTRSTRRSTPRSPGWRARPRACSCTV